MNEKKYIINGNITTKKNHVIENDSINNYVYLEMVYNDIIEYDNKSLSSDKNSRVVVIYNNIDGIRFTIQQGWTLYLFGIERDECLYIISYRIAKVRLRVLEKEMIDDYLNIYKDFELNDDREQSEQEQVQCR